MAMTTGRALEVKTKGLGNVALSESTESTDISSSEDAISAKRGEPLSPTAKANNSCATTPKRRLVQWSDLLDARMLARESEMDMDDSGGQQSADKGTPMVATRSEKVNNCTGANEFDCDSLSQYDQGKRRARRRRRHTVNVTTTDGITAAAARSPTAFSMMKERDGSTNSMDYFYSQQQVPSRFTGLSTHCDTTTSSISRGRRNVVTVNDLLGGDLSTGHKASSSASTPKYALSSAAKVFTPTPTCTINADPNVHHQASTQVDYGPWVDNCEAGTRTPWNPAAVTPCNPPYWTPSVYSENQVQPLQTSGYHGNGEVQPQPLTTWLQAAGLPSCADDLADQLRAVAPEAYED